MDRNRAHERTTGVPAGSVVVAYDGSPHSAAALTWGLAQARGENRPVDVVHLDNPVQSEEVAWLATSTAGLEAIAQLRRASADRLDKVVQRVSEQYPTLKIRSHVLECDARGGLVALSRSAHMVVLGSHGRGPFTSPLLGSVSAAVTRRAECPVVVLRPPRHGSAPSGGGAGVLVGVDGTPESRPVLEFAFAQASLHGRPLTAAHCVQDLLAAYVGDMGFLTQDEADEARAMLAQSVTGLCEKYPDVTVDRRLQRGVLAELADDVDHPWDLVVVGGRRHGAWHRLLVGSTSTAVLERAHCAVAVVPEAQRTG